MTSSRFTSASSAMSRSPSSLAYPKPPKRGKKPPKPLRRKAPLKRSSKRIKRQKAPRRLRERDPAAFRDGDINRVWGPDFECVETGSEEIEFHHILGRGKSSTAGFSFGYGHPNRELMSSVFNSIPLHPRIHKGPDRDKPAYRWRYLDIAYHAVWKAVDAGFYELKEIDLRFLQEVSGTWMARNPA